LRIDLISHEIDSVFIPRFIKQLFKTVASQFNIAMLFRPRFFTIPTFFFVRQAKLNAEL